MTYQAIIFDFYDVIYGHNRRPDTEIVALVEALSREYKVGLLSNAGPSLRGLLQAHGLERLFHHIALSGEVGVAKPRPEIFEHILEQLGVAPQQAIFIDDAADNVRAACALGMQGIVYRSVPALRRDLQALGVDT